MRISINVVIALVLVLITLIGVYAATDTVVSSGTGEANSTGNLFSNCMGEILGGEERSSDCEFFSSDGGESNE